MLKYGRQPFSNKLGVIDMTRPLMKFIRIVLLAVFLLIFPLSPVAQER